MAAKLDVLKAKETQIQAALDALDANVAAQTAAARRARSTTDTAAATLAKIAADEAAAHARIAALERRATDAATKEYLLAGTQQSLIPVDGSALDASARASITRFAIGNLATVVDDLQAAKDDLDELQAKATRILDDAKATQARKEALLAQLKKARSQQEAFAAKVEDRIDDALGEAAALSAVDAKLAAQIAARQSALAARLSRISASSVGRVSGSQVAGSVGSVDLVNVGGVIVARQIAGPLRQMMAASASAGLVLGGGGFRSAAAQVAVRRHNCGPSTYDIWHKPASQCRPPAALPGHSMHERGLAIDFTCNGALISSYSSACAKWLRQHGAAYGFYNRPGEAWHWSVNGH